MEQNRSFEESKMKELIKNVRIGIAIGSGGVYSVAGIGVLKRLEEEGIEIPFIGGASGGAIISALYFLEGDAESTKRKLLEKLLQLNKLDFKSWKKPMAGIKVKEIIEELLDHRNWQDGKIQDLCLGAALIDTHEPIILTKTSGLSLVDSVLASISLKMIEPIVKLESGKSIAHGGDPVYIKSIRNLGADFVIEVSPNLKNGVIGKVARLGNMLSSLAILKGDYIAGRRDTQREKNAEKANFGIHPNFNLKPLIFPLDFSAKNTEYMIRQGYILMNESMSQLKEELIKK